eukprot:c21955_g1_i2 orf=40-687(-)
MGKSQVVFVERYDSERRKRSRRRRTSRAGCADCFVHNAGAKRKEEGLDVSSEDEEVPKKRRSLLDIYKEGPCNAYKALDSRKKIQRSATPNIQGNSYEDLVCKNCRRGDGEQEMLLCDGCDEAYHMYCLCPILVRVPKGTWFCPVCSKKDRIAGLAFSSFLSNVSLWVCPGRKEAYGLLEFSVCAVPRSWIGGTEAFEEFDNMMSLPPCHVQFFF